MNIKGFRAAAATICMVALPVLALLASRGGAPSYVFALAISFTCCAALTPVVRRVAIAFDIVDQPGGRKIHRDPTALLGGVAVAVALFLAIVVCGGTAALSWPVLAGAGIILVCGIIDDKTGNLPAKVRMLLQAAAGGLAIYGGAVFDLGPGVPLKIAAILVTLLWYTGIVNAVNFLDGMDGLASGICAAAAAGLCAAGIGMPGVSAAAAAICGACLGFMVHNFNPATIFLGDAGSTTLGFLLAALGASVRWAPGDRFQSFLVPVAAMMIPIFDMVFTTVDRFGTGKVHTIFEWMVYTGRDHFHHRVSALGLGVRRSVLIIIGIGAALGVGAYEASRLNALAALGIIATAAVSLTLFTLYLISVEKKAAAK